MKVPAYDYFHSFSFFLSHCQSFWSDPSNTVEPCSMSLIRSMTELVLRFTHFANQFILLKLIEIKLICSVYYFLFQLYCNKLFLPISTILCTNFFQTVRDCTYTILYRPHQPHSLTPILWHIPHWPFIWLVISYILFFFPLLYCCPNCSFPSLYLSIPNTHYFNILTESPHFYLDNIISFLQ